MIKLAFIIALIALAVWAARGLDDKKQQKIAIVFGVTLFIACFAFIISELVR